MDSLLGNLKLISLLQTRELTHTHTLAYQYIVMQGLKLRFLYRNLNWSSSANAVRSLLSVAQARGLETEEEVNIISELG